MLVKLYISRNCLAIFILVFALSICYLPAQAQDDTSADDSTPTLNDSFGSNTQDSAYPSGSTGDAFNVNSPDLWNTNIANMAGGQVDQLGKGFGQSLPSDPTALKTILGSLTQRYLNKTSRSNQNEQTLFWVYWGSAMDKLHNAMMDLVSKRLTPDEICDKLQKTPEFKCILAWNNVLQAMKALPPLTLYGGTVYSQRKADVTKALAQAEQTCQCAIPSPQSNIMPQAAPQRPGTMPTTAPPLKGNVSDNNSGGQPSARNTGSPPQSGMAQQSPLVLRGKIVSDAHFQKVKSIIDQLPSNIQELLRKHHTKIIAADTVVGQHPESGGVQPRGWVDGHWENSDGMYYRATNEVIVAARYLSGNQWQKAPRVNAVTRHETGHAVDHDMGDYSHNNKEFKDSYYSEKIKLPASAKKALRYIIQKDDAGPEEAFSEIFGIIYGGTAGGPEVQKLIETYFPKTLKMLKNVLNSLH